MWLKEKVLLDTMFSLSVVFALVMCVAGAHLGKHHKAGKLSGGRIVGGEETTVEDRPYQVSLSISMGGQNYLCGGSIISNDTILTAAHCLVGASGVTVRSGSTYFQSGGKTTSARSYVTHPQYNTQTHDYDVAIVKLRGALTFSDTTRKVPLAPAGSTIPGGAPVTVSGWGTTKENGQVSDTLMEVTVPIVNRTECQKAYGASSITTRMICAGEDGKDSCQGDSGGPLVNDQGTQVGIVSFGHGCARPDYPGVYANVAALRSFIKRFGGV